MTPHRVSATLILVAILGLAITVRVIGWPLARMSVPARAEIKAAAEATSPVARPDSLAAVVVAYDPFRIGRRPASVAYDPVPVALPATPPPPRPTLVLVGIVWDGGRDPAALVEGLPGSDGPRSVHRGDTIGGLRVTRIVANHVIISGPDTTWTLTVREPWK